MTIIKGKKLLILGANAETIPLVEAAKDMGVFTMVTDHNPAAPAKKYANKSFDIDGLDVNGLIQLCKNEKVDGVLVGVADRLIWSYHQVCKALNLPCYASKEQCNYFTDKQKFNQLCSKYNIQTIPNFNEAFRKKEYDNITYPVFVKPTDANSGKGMSLCYNIDELFLGVEKALQFSDSKSYLLERYMQCDDMFIYYTFQRGEVIVSAIADRYTTGEQGNLSRVCIGAVYPSKYSQLYFDTLHERMLSMFKSIGVRDGVFMISAFVENDKIYLYDPGFRLQGEAPNIVISALGGYNHLTMLVNFALTNLMSEGEGISWDNFNFQGKKAATLWILSKAGKIESIKGISELNGKSNIMKVVQRLYQGDTVTEAMVGTEAQVVARIYVNANSLGELGRFVNEIYQQIEMHDAVGNSLFIQGLSGDIIGCK